MDEKKQPLALDDKAMSGVTGGAASLETTNKDGFTRSEVFYCPKCGTRLDVVEEKRNLYHGIQHLHFYVDETVCRCSKCHGSWYPDALRGDPNTYWYQDTKNF